MSEIHKDVVQHPRQRCYFCGSEGPIETHHIVPKRFDGTDNEENLVDLCANCHRRLEKLYDKRFYKKLEAVASAQPEVNYKLPQIKKEIDNICQSVEQKPDIVDWLESCTEYNKKESELIVDDFIDKGLLAKTENGIVQAYEIESRKVLSIRSNNTTIMNKTMKDVIDNLDQKDDDGVGAKIDKIRSKAKTEFNLSDQQIEKKLEKLFKKGEIFEPVENRLSTT